jgi:hypothetical protein
MTLNFSLWQCQAFMAAASRHQRAHHGYRHPPPPLHRTHFSRHLPLFICAAGRSAGCGRMFTPVHTPVISSVGPRSP